MCTFTAGVPACETRQTFSSVPTIHSDGVVAINPILKQEHFYPAMNQYKKRFLINI